MPELLGATNPVPGHDRTPISSNIAPSQDNPQIRNVVDPSRVSRADGRSEQQDSAREDLSQIRYDSNFQTFLQRLRGTESLPETLSRLLGGQTGTVVLSGLSEGIAAELSQALEMLEMTPEQLLQFLTGSMRAGTRFQGALFALLRGAYANASSDHVRGDILQFLRSYLDNASSSHIEGNLLRNLDRMAGAMPDSWADKLRELTAQLKNDLAAGDRQESIALMKRSIIPLMSSYVDATHDMGTPRQLLSLLTLDLARYENGSTENLLELFHQLTSYGTLKGQLGAIDDQSLLQLLRSAQAPPSSATVFSDHLAAAAARAMRGEGSGDTQQVFQQLVSALLINESVYMPVNHVLIPMSMDGRMLFSELWVDPDAQEKGSSGSGRQGNTVKCLFKMDVQSLGLFDVVLVSQDKQVDLRISCPQTVAPFSKEIEKAMAEILTRNGLTPAAVSVREMDKPVALTEVFPKIFEGKNSVNVKV
jgi:hypothetical protein